MTFTVFNAAGEAIAGDDSIDDGLRALADREGGHIENESGQRVYPLEQEEN